ncbi:MAG: hypothetical protein AAFY98_06415 [Verrucomicrobiota bacterium]
MKPLPFLLFSLFICYFTGGFTSHSIEITPSQAENIGKRLWQNECSGTIAGLTSWNKGESFASLGIGHFIWYPPGQEGPFSESFPQLVTYLQSKGVTCPEWILPPSDCPWSTLAEFDAAQDSKRMIELRTLLSETVGHQALFAARRLSQALPLILETLPEEERPRIRENFGKVSAHPHGYYVLVDYVNFKGEGIKPEERYQGYGWGLLQVLEAMEESEAGGPALNAFSAAAIQVLQRRVDHSPPARGESRWMKGWTNRCRTYRLP